MTGESTPLTQRKRLIDGQDMAEGNFLRTGVHDDFLNQEAHTVFAFRKASSREVSVHALGEHGKLLDQL